MARSLLLAFIASVALSTFDASNASSPTPLPVSKRPPQGDVEVLVARPHESQVDRATSAVELAPVVTLRDRGGSLPDSAFSVVPTANGEFLIPSKRRDRVLVFDKSGNLRTTLLTNRGTSFTTIGAILPVPGGGFVIHDGRGGELYPLTADLKVGSPTALRHSPSLALADGELIVADQIRTPALAGFPIHLFDRSGQVVRSFGADTPQLREDMRVVTNRIVGAARNGTILAAAPGRYVLERWDPRLGKRLTAVPVRSSWFVESTRSEPDERIRPKPILLSLSEDQDIAWVVLLDADQNWRVPANANTERSFDISEYSNKFDWVIEAVDLKSGAVLGSLRSDSPVMGRSPSPYFVVNNKKDPLELVVLRPQLKRRTP